VKGIVYEISNDVDDKIYRGMSLITNGRTALQQAEKRFAEHKQATAKGKTPAYLHFAKVGVDHLAVKVLHHGQYKHKQQCFDDETHFIMAVDEEKTLNKKARNKKWDEQIRVHDKRENGVTPMLVDKRLPTLSKKSKTHAAISYVEKGEEKITRVEFKISVKNKRFNFETCETKARAKLKAVLDEHYVDVAEGFADEQVGNYIKELRLIDAVLHPTEPHMPAPAPKRKRKSGVVVTANKKRMPPTIDYCECCARGRPADKQYCPATNGTHLVCDVCFSKHGKCPLC